MREVKTKKKKKERRRKLDEEWAVEGKKEGTDKRPGMVGEGATSEPHK